MQVGLIGGIGPAATEVYYRALVRAGAAAGKRLELAIVHADVREMIGNLEAGRKQEQATVFARFVDQLRAAGCEKAAVTSMGGHFCISELEAISSLPLISAIPAMESFFAAAGYARVGVLGTRQVMETGLYGLGPVEVIAPSPGDLIEVHEAYTAIARAGSATPEQRSFFHREAHKLRDNLGAEAVVLGGTDLSVAFDLAEELGMPIVDSAQVHAAAIARVALDSGGGSPPAKHAS